MSDESKSEIVLTDSIRLQNNLNGIGRQEDFSSFIKGTGVGTLDDSENNRFPAEDERYQYGVTISYTDSYIEDGKIKTKNFYQPLDLITSVSEKLSSQITSYPMTDKDYVMDHAFSEPITVTISGMFGLHGRNARTERESKSNGTYSYTKNIYPPAIDKLAPSETSSRLMKIQETFERLKDDGYIVSLTTIDNSGDPLSARLAFKRRPSMVLTDISWDTENPSVLKYSFTFKEIRFATISEENMFVYDSSDDSLVGLTDPTELTFSQSVLDFSDIVDQFVKAAYNDEFITYDFLEMFIEDVQSDTSITSLDYETAKKAVLKMFKSNDGKLDPDKLTYGGPDAGYAIAYAFFGLFISMFKDAGATWKSIGVSTAVVTTATITIAIALKVAAVAAAGSGPVGWIVGGIIAIAASIGYIGYTLWKNFVGLNRYNMERFYKSWFGSKNKRNIVRFAALISSLQNEISQFDSYIKAYTFTTDDDQVAGLIYDNIVYRFKFTKNSTADGGGYNLAIIDDDGAEIGTSGANGRVILNENLIPSSGGSLSGFNTLDSRLGNPYKVAFIRNASAVSSFLSNGNDPDDVKNHLTNYTMLITTVDLTRFEELLNKTLQNIFMKD